MKTSVSIGIVFALGVIFWYSIVYFLSEDIFIEQSPELEKAQEDEPFFAGTISAPDYKGGVDGGGLLNSGTVTSPQPANTTGGRSLLVSDGYLYVAYNASSTACSSTASNGNGCELKVFDISSGASPTYVGGGDASGSTNSGTASSAFFGLAKVGDYLFVAKAGSATACSNTPGSAIGCEFQVWDVSTPSTPTYVAGGDATGNVGSGTGNLAASSIAASGTVAVMTMSGSATACAGTAGAMRCEVMVWDITTPTAPTYASGGDASGSSESGTTNLTARDVFILGNRAYTVWNLSGTACSSSAGSAVGCELKVWDISTPTAISYSGGGDRSGATNASTTNTSNLTRVFGHGNYVYTSGGAGAGANGCTGTAGFAAGCELMVWDVSTPGTPTYVAGGDAGGQINTEAGNVDAYGLATTSVSGSTYLAQTFAGSGTSCGNAVGTKRCELYLWDISTPTAPTFVVGMDASGQTTAGTGNQTMASVAFSSTHIYTGDGAGSNAACSSTVGSGIGCELKVWEIVASAVSTVIEEAQEMLLFF